MNDDGERANRQRRIAMAKRQEREVQHAARAALAGALDPTMHRVLVRERLLARIASVLMVCVVLMCIGSVVVAAAALSARKDTAARATAQITELNRQLAELHRDASANTARIAELEAEVRALVEQLKQSGLTPVVEVPTGGSGTTTTTIRPSTSTTTTTVRPRGQAAPATTTTTTTRPPSTTTTTAPPPVTTTTTVPAPIPLPVPVPPIVCALGICVS